MNFSFDGVPKNFLRAAEWVRVIDWEQPANNDLLLVSPFNVTVRAVEMTNEDFRLSHWLNFEIRTSAFGFPPPSAPPSRAEELKRRFKLWFGKK